MDTIPLPRDERVVLGEIRERALAVLRFRGHASKNVVKEKLEVLLDTLGEEGISTVGEPFLMRYNPPFTPGFLRRNEVAVEASY